MELFHQQTQYSIAKDTSSIVDEVSFYVLDLGDVPNSFLYILQK